VLGEPLVRQLGFAISCAVALAALTGCKTTIEESRVLQAVQDNGDIAYYRIQLKADAKLAKTHYRAGLYDAEAIDALFGSVKQDDQDAVDQILERRRREAVSKISAEYYRALEKGESTEGLLKRLSESMKSPYVTIQEVGNKTASPPRRKYAIIFSALASAIEEAIANFAEEKETEEITMSAIAGVQRQRLIRTKVDSEGIDAARRRLKAIETDALKLQTDSSTYVGDLRRLLDDAASIIVD
jgi:hypothetical protein